MVKFFKVGRSDARLCLSKALFLGHETQIKKISFLFDVVVTSTIMLWYSPRYRDSIMPSFKD